MAKKDNIIDFRDYQPGKRETIETHDLNSFRSTLYDLGFLGPSSSDTLDETEEVEPETEVEETEAVSSSEAVEEPTVEVEVDETSDPVTEEGTSETDDKSKEDFEKPPFVVSKKFPKIKSTKHLGGLKNISKKADDEKIDYEESSLSDLIIKATKEEEEKCGFKRFDSDEPLVEDDSDETVVSEADFEEVDSKPEKKPSDFEEEPHTSKTRTSSFGNFLKKFEKTNFAERILSNFGLGEKPSKAAEEESKTEDSTTKSEFNSKAQELISKEIMGGKVDKLKEWSKNDNVNKLMFLFSGNSVLSDWIMENEPDIFWDLPDEVIDVILEKNKKSSEKKDDKDKKKS